MIFSIPKLMKSIILLFLLFCCISLKSQQTLPNCTNWLYTSSQPGLVTIGDLDIPGNQVTIEATVNRLSNFSNGVSTESDIVSKHTDPSNANYLLRPTRALITTTNGFFFTPDVCPIELNKTYHVAMVYDGLTLKFYRNGFLMSQVLATGDLIQNNFETAIGLLSAQSLNENFIGYINEVRIWNVARTQNELRAFMSSSLPAPTTQVGLLAYYTFDNLLNKQGNPAWNGSLIGSGTINALNPSCIFIPDSCAILQPTVCNTTLSTPSNGSYATIGDLDVSGFSITVEATINRTTPYLPGTGDGNDGDIVSKHLGPPNTNYLLRPNHAYITTSDGFFATPDVCEIDLNKTYYLAMVYDGNSLKFYRNGFLMSQIPATGTLLQNDYPTRIGMYTGVTSETFIGYTNEVRIWNIARTQAQIKAYMGIPLPNPPTQPGLQAYYVFDNLLNKQGNPLWNATLSGAAGINQVNPKCPIIFDSCVVVPISHTSYTINEYTPVNSIDICINTLLVQDASKFNVGDTVLLMQMQGAVIDSSNSVSFGTVLDYKNQGHYEFNTVKSKNGNLVGLLNTINQSYDLSNGKIQMVRVPYLANLKNTDTLTCLPWDGMKGGILAFNVRDTLELLNNIDVTGKGFFTDVLSDTVIINSSCNENEFFYSSSTPLLGAAKGRGVATFQPDKSLGKGAPANGGGGGNKDKSGGGGGANGGAGGFGGFQSDACNTIAGFDNRGIGGHPITYSNINDRISLGGSGGSGNSNNGTTVVPAGGSGGGIIFVNAHYLKSNGYKIVANGTAGNACSKTPGNCLIGGAGGGGGGAIIAGIGTYLDAGVLELNGGNGANMTNGFTRAGPGGGGGGGIILIRQVPLPAQVTINNSGGNNGVCTAFTNDSYGASKGNGGVSFDNATAHVDNILFKPNIDSVRFKITTTICNSFDFFGISFTRISPIVSWHWIFDDGTTASTQNTSHTYVSARTSLVKLVVTDINGCQDSIIKPISIKLATVDAGLDTTYCTSTTITRTLNAAGEGTFQWSPSQFLDNNTSQNPVATINVSTKFYVFLTTASGCIASDSVMVIVNKLPIIKSIEDSFLCKGSTLILLTTGATSYSWSPSNSVNNPLTANPNFVGQNSQQLIVKGIDLNGCVNFDTINILVKPLPMVRTIADSLTCSTTRITLTTTGAQNYFWSPSAGLNNATISNPEFLGIVGQQYIVTGTTNGCEGKDTVNISIRQKSNLNAPPYAEFCLNTSVTLNGNNGTENFKYRWSPSTYLSNSDIINPNASPPTTQNYLLTVTDNICKYDSNFNVRVTVNPLPNVNAHKSNDITCANAKSILTASGATSYSWTPIETLVNFMSPSATAKPTSTTVYNVTGINSKGCQNSDSVKVFYKSSLTAYNLPNTFTPNGDGLNECFGVRQWGDIQSLDFKIYNRWGIKVFETRNSFQCWNGSFKGSPAEIGNYVYYIHAITACGDIVKKGNVILLR